MKICEDYGILIDTIPELNTEITQLYLDKVLSDIIKDILQLCGGGYNLDVTPKGIRIYKIGDIYAYPEFRISPNTRLVYSPNFRGNVSRSRSIEEMKNSIKVVSEKDNVYAHLKTLKDETNIGKFGLLQKVVKIDTEKENADTVANTQLSELNKVSETFSTEIIEATDSYTRAGSIINIADTNYLIEGSTHNIKKWYSLCEIRFKAVDCMNGITELAKLLKERENGTGYSPMFGTIIELPQIKIRLNEKVILNNSHLKYCVNLKEQNEDGDYIYVGKIRFLRTIFGGFSFSTFRCGFNI